MQNAPHATQLVRLCLLVSMLLEMMTHALPPSSSPYKRRLYLAPSPVADHETGATFTRQRPIDYGKRGREKKSRYGGYSPKTSIVSMNVVYDSKGHKTYSTFIILCTLLGGFSFLSIMHGWVSSIIL